MFEKTKSRTGFSWGVVGRETEISFITVVSQVQFPPFVITLTWLQSPPWSRHTSWTSHSHQLPDTFQDGAFPYQSARYTLAGGAKSTQVCSPTRKKNAVLTSEVKYFC